MEHVAAIAFVVFILVILLLVFVVFKDQIDVLIEEFRGQLVLKGESDLGEESYYSDIAGLITEDMTTDKKLEVFFAYFNPTSYYGKFSEITVDEDGAIGTENFKPFFFGLNPGETISCSQAKDAIFNGLKKYVPQTHNDYTYKLGDGSLKEVFSSSSGINNNDCWDTAFDGFYDTVESTNSIYIYCNNQDYTSRIKVRVGVKEVCKVDDKTCKFWPIIAICGE